MDAERNNIRWLPKYTSKELQIFLSVVPILVIVLNIALFGKQYFTDLKIFIVSSLVIFAVLALLWQLLTVVAITVRNHFYRDKDTVKRLAITILFIALICALASTVIFGTYDYFNFLGYRFNETRYQWTLGVGVVINIFVTLLHEGVESFDKWKATLVETEQLKKEYMQSQLLGLKSQVNPHFLFNSLNSLSSLINENQEKAEIFLDEMSKVYRYLLRNSDDQLVTLETELQFIASYSYLLKVRYGDGINIIVEIDRQNRQQLLPPLTLQVLVEHAYNANMISKDHPLHIHIYTPEHGWMEVKNNIQKKIADENTADNTGIENIINKFRLLCQQSVLIKEIDGQRIIRIPLIPEPEMSMV
jgi:two-component system LytT family sensor kinase